MVLSSTSAAGVRFLASVKEGRGLKRSAREAGVHQEVGYRWLRECYLSLRRNGGTTAATKALLGFLSARMAVWETEVGGSDRHHLRVDEGVEVVFWNAYKSGLDLTAAAGVAGVGRSTAYRWLERRFNELRDAGTTLRDTQRLLRLADQVAARAEQGRRDRVVAGRRAALSARREALRSSRQFADRAAGPTVSTLERRRADRVDAYWRLMRSGETNTSAARLLGMSRRSGTNIRRAQQHQTHRPAPPAPSSGRYLDLRERLQLATCSGSTSQCGVSPTSSAGIPPRSRGNWTGTATWPGAICLGRPTTRPACSPWQRGANENFNGLARQYFPKGTNLAVHTAAHVAHVTAELNDRPRKGLGYDTPAFRFAAETAAGIA